MLISLTGLLQDGSPPVYGVPTIGGDKIALPVGESLTLQLVTLTPSGNVVQLSGSSLVLSVTKDPKFSAGPLLQKTATVAGTTATFSFVPGDTKTLMIPGYYYYDVWLTDGSGNRNQVVPLQAFILTPTATPPP